MRFVRFTGDAGPVLAVLDGELARPIEGFDDLLPLLRAGTPALLEAGERALSGSGRSDGSGEPVSLEGRDMLSPIATPPTLRDFYAFEQHVRAGRSWRGLEMEPDWYELPVFYFSNPYAVVGDGDIAIPPGSEKFDFELEVAAVLAGGGSDLTPEQGEDMVAGYCVLNDWSARDVQQREMKLSMGPVKGKDGATGLGPIFVTKDELEDVKEKTGYRLRMSCTVNGTQYSDALWSDVYWSFGEMISYASRGSRVEAGDVFGSGTCGTGCILELSRSGRGDVPWLMPGDIVTASVERLGTLTNRIVAGPALIPLR